MPRSLYFFFAAAVFIYVNLDCMDGRQARRTGSSSPLGQLFDHGCDALSLHMLLDTVRTSLQLPGGWGAVTMEMAVSADATTAQNYTEVPDCQRLQTG